MVKVYVKMMKAEEISAGKTLGSLTTVLQQ